MSFFIIIINDNLTKNQTMSSSHAYDSTHRILQHLLTNHPSPLHLSSYCSNQSSLKGSINMNDKQQQDDGGCVQLNESDSDGFPFQIEVDLGDGRAEIIFVDQNTDAREEAIAFCQKYHLEEFVIDLLAKAITQKSNSERQLIRKQKIMKQTEKMREIYSGMQVQELLISEKDDHYEQKQPQNLPQTTLNTEKAIKQRSSSSKIARKSSHQVKGADKILMNSRKYKSKRNSVLQAYAEKQNTPNYNTPSINPISQQICNRIGKETIISANQRKSRDKLKNIQKEREEYANRQLQECHFHPKINIISEKVDQQMKQSIIQNSSKRYEQLYENFKEIEMKKEAYRKHSLSQISFKPKINELSRCIMQNKRSKVFNEESAKQIYSNVKRKSNSKDYQLNGSYNENNRSLPNTNRKLKSRNPQNLSIGHHLYNEAMKQQSKKKSLQFYEKSEACRILDHSQYLVSVLKQKRINEIFTQLTHYPHQYLTHSDINLSSQMFKIGIYRLFLPIFNEMIEYGAQLSRSQFMDASLKLLKYLSPEQKSQIMLKKDKSKNENNDKYEKKPLINSKSREILKGKDYDKNSIYVRGLFLKKELKQKAQKGRQDRVRQQLQNCTFKPSINKKFQFAA